MKNINKKTVSDVLLDCLVSLKVKYIFGVPGDIQTDLWHSLKNRSDISFIAFKNEKSAAFAADIYCRTSGRTRGEQRVEWHSAVCFSTVGPGMTNLVSAAANATMDRSPLVCISDQVNSLGLDNETHQYINSKKLFSQDTNVAKDSFILESADSIVQTVLSAFNVAFEEKMGAVHISIPHEMWGKNCSSTPPKNYYKNFKNKIKIDSPNNKDISKAAKILNKTKSGLILTGGSINRSKSWYSFEKMVDHLNFPVFSTFRGKGCINSDHPLHIGTLSRHFENVNKSIFSKVDTIVLVGYDYNEGVKPDIWSGIKNIINIDLKDNTVQNIFSPKNNIFGNLDETFLSLCQLTETSTNSVNINKIKKDIKNIIYGDIDHDSFPFRPTRIMEIINSTFKEDSIIVGDVGNNKYYSGLLYNPGKNSQIIFSNGQSSMAFSSGAIGASFANPNKNIIAISGDGGFLMNPQEIITAVKHNKYLIEIVFVDNAYGLVKSKQEKDFGVNKFHSSLTFQNPDYVSLAKSLGAKGYFINSMNNFLEILNKIKEQKSGVHLIAVPVEYGGGAI